MKSSSPVRLGIIGVGNMGSHYVGLLERGAVKNCVLTAICDVDEAKLQKYAGDSRRGFSRAKDLFAAKAVDAVLIATPHYAHTTVGIAALKAGLHVLAEKPLSVHKADCQKLLAAHKNKRQVFATVFNQRTDPRYQKIREMVSSGELGKIQRIQWTVTDWFRSEAYYASGGWRATWAGEGGGVLLNQSVHNLDLYQWLFGMPKEVRAVCKLGRFHRIEVEDDVTAMFGHAGGTTGVFVTTTGETPGVNRLEVAGDNGLLSLEGNKLTFRRNLVPTSVHSRTTKEGFKRPENETVVTEFKDSGPQHTGILQNFINTIRGEEKLIAPAAAGVNAVELINAMLLSSFRDEPVKLPLSAPVYAKLLGKLIKQSKPIKRRPVQDAGGLPPPSR